MSLLSVRLENFRGFRNAYIETKPLTVLVGENSSGKSSFSHALSAMAHAQRLYALSPGLTLTPLATPEEWPADLGDLDDLRKAGTDGPVYISIETDQGTVRWGFGLDTKDSRRSLEISSIEQPAGLASSPSTGSIAMPTAIAPVAISGVFLTEVEELELFSQTQQFIKINEQQWREQPGDIESYVDFRGLVIHNVTHPRGTHVQLNSVIGRAVQTIFSDLSYLRATRLRPVRSYQRRLRTSDQALGYGGEGVADLLQEHATDEIEFILPPAEQIVVKGKTQFLRSHWQPKRDSLVNFVNLWLQHAGLAHSVEARPHPVFAASLQIRIKICEGPAHDISEVGFGLSQILPVIISGLLQRPGGPLIVDLPEAHLHPKPQAAIADFFCAMALSKRSCIVETHSEMFVNQLRLRAEMDESLADKIAIYFLDKPEQGDCLPPRRIGLEEKDQIRWPQGFLEEAWEIESKISNIRIARRS